MNSKNSNRTKKMGNTEMPPDGRSEKANGEPQIYSGIGVKLREYYDEIANQPIPDRFVEMLKALEEKAKRET